MQRPANDRRELRHDVKAGIRKAPLDLGKIRLGDPGFRMNVALTEAGGLTSATEIRGKHFAFWCNMGVSFPTIIRGSPLFSGLLFRTFSHWFVAL